MSDTDRLHRAGEYLRKQEQHQHADAVDQIKLPKEYA